MLVVFILLILFLDQYRQLSSIKPEMSL
jgi:hypothetical protein